MEIVCRTKSCSFEELPVGCVFTIVGTGERFYKIVEYDCHQVDSAGNPVVANAVNLTTHDLQFCEPYFTCVDLNAQLYVD